MQRIGSKLPQPIATGVVVFSTPAPSEFRQGFNTEAESSHGCLDAPWNIAQGSVDTYSWTNGNGDAWWFPTQAVARPS